MRIKFLIFAAFIFTGCQKLFFKDDPANTPVNNFQIFWNDFNNYYAQFGIRRINWDSVYTVYYPQVKLNSSDQQLFKVLSGMVTLLNDMHVNLETTVGNASCKTPYPSKYPSRILIAYQNGINPIYVNEVLGYAFYNNIGYIQIFTFITEGKVSNGSDSRYSAIDQILPKFANQDGIIIDVRGNGGGTASNALTIASRFADTIRLSYKLKFKNGTGKNDFTDWQNYYIETGGNFQFKKPVVVLTSRATGSAAEMFVAYMNVLPQVTIVGDTTGGGTGSPIFRELPNGWIYRLSTEYGETANNKLIDGKGIVPGITVQTSVTDSINGIDRMVEKAVEVIESQKNK